MPSRAHQAASRLGPIAAGRTFCHRIIPIAAVFACCLAVLLPAARGESGQTTVLRATWVAKGSAAPQPAATVQHALSIAQPVAIRSSATRSAHRSPTVLRWRTSTINQTHMPPAPVPSDISRVVPATVIHPYPTTIRPVGLERPLPRSEGATNVSKDDPFADPFGDRDRAPVPAQPLSEASAAPIPQPATAPQPTPAMTVGQQVPDQAPILEDPPPQPLPAPPVVNDMKPTVSQNCTRVYNQRDCCKEGGQCDRALRKWQHSSLSKISLDITPSFKPDESDLLKEETERDRELSKAPVRTWRDRQGNILATGRLTNIKRGRLLILTPNNDVIKLRFDDLSDDDLCFLTAWWGVPTECTLGDETFAGRNWMPMSFTWKASAVSHKPLYFEETALERYGHTAGPIRQPILSGAHFFASLVTLPYQAGINPPWECRYPLGTYRPGSCAPYFLPPVPLSVRGGLLEAGTWVGGIFLIP